MAGLFGEIKSKGRYSMGETAGKIRDIGKLLEGVPNLGLYGGDFGEHNLNIYPTDLDGIVEIKGNFLIHEYKKVGVGIPEGQSIMQKAFLEKGFTVINIWHKGSCWDMDLIKAQVFTPQYLSNDGKTEWEFITDVLNRIRHFHKWWTNKVLNL